jgi:hypothetical protein
VQSLGALVAASALPSEQTQKPIFRAINLNHVALATNDLDRTQEFYQRVFGMPAFGRDENGVAGELLFLPRFLRIPRPATIL